jgi:hypothetical protein
MSVLGILGKRFGIDVHDHLVALPRRPNRRVVGKRAVGDQHQRIGVVYRFRGTALGVLADGCLPRLDRLEEQSPILRRESAANAKAAILIP